MVMLLKSYNDIGASEWDAFCNDSPDAWFQHTTHWIEYTLAIRDDKSLEHASFGVFEDNRLLAIVPVIIDTRYRGSCRAGTMLGFPLPYPALYSDLTEKKKSKVVQFIFNEIDRHALDYVQYYVQPLAPSTAALRVNPILEKGFTNQTIATNMLILEGVDEHSLYQKMSGNRRRDIAFCEKEGYSVRIFCQDNTDEALAIYQAIHLAAAGRKTRPDATWGCMAEWLSNGLSMLAIAYFDGMPVSGVLVNLYKERAFYQSGATLPDVASVRGLGHLLQWEVVRALKGLDVTHYDVGWQWYPNFSMDMADKKMLDISAFKAGTGAALVPLYRGERFTSAPLMHSVYAERMAMFDHSLQGVG